MDTQRRAQVCLPACREGTPKLCTRACMDGCAHACYREDSTGCSPPPAGVPLGQRAAVHGLSVKRGVVFAFGEVGKGGRVSHSCPQTRARPP